MTRFFLTLTLTLPLALLQAVALHATDNDGPLALTGLAGVQGPLSPTAGDQALSQQYLAEGMDSLRNGHAGAALQALLDSVRLAPDADNTKALGTAYYQLGNLPKAAWAYRQSLQWRPDGRVQSLLDQLQADGSAPDVCGGGQALAELATAGAAEATTSSAGIRKTPTAHGKEAPK